MWRQEIPELGGTTERGDKRSQNWEVPRNVETRDPRIVRYQGMWRQEILGLECGDKSYQLVSCHRGLFQGRKQTSVYLLVIHKTKCKTFHMTFLNNSLSKHFTQTLPKHTSYFIKTHQEILVLGGTTERGDKRLQDQEVPRNVETRDDIARRYQGMWTQEVLLLGVSMEYVHKRSETQKVAQNVETRVLIAKTYRRLQ